MKKIITVFAILTALFIPQLSYAGVVSPWPVSILEVYVQKGPYSGDMTSAVRKWITPLKGRLFANIMGSKIKQSIAHIEFYFDSNEKDGVIEQGYKVGSKPYVSININTDGLTEQEINAKLLHWAGVSLGLDNSENQDSVMYKTPIAGQKILDEDINNLKKLYSVKIKVKPVKSN